MIRCDFCFAEAPEFVYEAKSFQTVIQFAPHKRFLWGSRDDWAACQECADLIRTKNWDRLVKKVTDFQMKRYELPEVMRPILKRELTELYLLLQQHHTGKMYRKFFKN